MSELIKQAENHWRFFRAWVKAPLSTASVVPSSKALAEKMLAEIPEGATHVIELGAGTGAFTRLLLERDGLERLMVVELNPEMVSDLRAEFPDALVIEGDAQELRDLIGKARAANSDHGEEKLAFPEQADAVISGLGFLTMPNEIVQGIVAASFSVLKPGAPLIQFTYGPRSPITRSICKALHLKVRRASFTLRNFPPASVYVYSQDTNR